MTHIVKRFLPNFLTISETVAEILRFKKVKMAAILDVLFMYLDDPLRVFSGVYHYAKFCWNRYSIFDNMQLTFNMLQVWLENAYSRP